MLVGWSCWLSICCGWCICLSLLLWLVIVVGFVVIVVVVWFVVVVVWSLSIILVVILVSGRYSCDCPFENFCVVVD